MFYLLCNLFNLITSERVDEYSDISDGWYLNFKIQKNKNSKKSCT